MDSHFWLYYLMAALGASNLGFAYRHHAKGDVNYAAVQIAVGAFVIGVMFVYLLGGAS